MSTAAVVEQDPLEDHLLEALRALQAERRAAQRLHPRSEEIWRAQVDSSPGRLRGALAAAARAELLHDRLGGALSRTRRSRSRCGRPIRRSSTTAPAPSTSHGQRRPRRDGVRDIMLGVVAARGEPIAGGRHKVFGHQELAVIPHDLDDRLAPAARRRDRVRDRRAAKRSASMQPVEARRGRRLLVRRRLRSTTPTAQAAPQHHRPHRRTRACRCRSSSSARTTGSGSAFRRRRAGSSPRSRARPALRYECAVRRRPGPRCSGVAEELAGWVRRAPRDRPCCTCARCAT